MLLGEADQLCEPFGVFSRHVGKDLAVQRDPGLLQSVDESPIAQVLPAYRREHLYDAMFHAWNNLNS